MWKIIPSSALGIAFTVLTVTLALVTWSIRYDTDERTILSFIFVALSSATPVITTILILGRSQRVWQMTCKWFPNFAKKYDIGGKWVGTTRSTYKLGQKLDDSELYESKMTMDIIQSWIHFSVRTTRPDTTTVGKSVLAEAVLNDGTPTFYTVFSGYNFKPTKGDSDQWFGTSRFEYFAENDCIVGAYCSNRGYLHGSSTAGDFCLNRPNENTVPNDPKESSAPHESEQSTIPEG